MILVCPFHVFLLLASLLLLTLGLVYFFFLVPWGIRMRCLSDLIVGLYCFYFPLLVLFCWHLLCYFYSAFYFLLIYTEYTNNSSDMNLNYGDAHASLFQVLYSGTKKTETPTHRWWGEGRSSEIMGCERTNEQNKSLELALRALRESTSSGSSLPEATWITPSFSPSNVSSSGCKSLFEATASSCHQGRFPPRSLARGQACLQSSDIWMSERRVSFKWGRGHRHGLQRAHGKECQGAAASRKAALGPQTWYPLETSISSHL